MTDEKIKPEFSRPFNTERLHDAPRHEHIEANAQERAALAKRFGIIDIASFSADLTLERMRDDARIVDVRGTLKAKLTQACIVTTEPVEEDVDDTFETMFASQGFVERWLKDNPHDEYEAPEPLENGWFDMGELAAQYLSLAMNEYPRKPGIEVVDEFPEEQKVNPFAILAKLKK